MTEVMTESIPDEVTEVMAHYVAEAASKPLPDAVTNKTSYHILDTLAAIVSGSVLHAGQVGIRYLRGQGGIEESSVIGANFSTSATLAALGNGISAHADETDDSHAPSFSHPGCAVVPAAIAVAERNQSSGLELVRSVALGYDIGCRVTPALGIQQFALSKNSRSSHAIVGVFGAAAAAAALERLTPIECEYVLSYAAQQSSGLASLIRDQDHVEKAFVIAGMGARDGVSSALMVASGFTGVRHAFSGSPSALDSLSDQADRSVLIDGLGQNFEIIRTNIKKYAVGSPVQAAVQAVEDLMVECNFDSSTIHQVDVFLPSDLIGVVDARDMPNVNCQYLVAGTFLDGGFSFEMAHDEVRFRDAQIRSLMSRVTLLPDESMRGKRQSRVIVTMSDGSRIEKFVEAVRGTADNPMTETEVVAKSLDLMSPILGEVTARRLADALLDPESIEDVRQLSLLWRLP